MDLEISPAASFVPRIGEKLTHGLCSFKDRFILERSTTPDQQALSPLFQSIQKGFPTNGIHFNHNEENAISSNSQSSTLLPIDDLDSIDTNDLFSFLLDERSTANSKSIIDNELFDNLTPFLNSPLSMTPSAELSTNLDIPNVIEFSLVNSPKQKSDSLFLSDSSSVEERNTNADSSHFSENDANKYVNEDWEYIESGMVSPRRDLSDNRSTSPLYLHNEDLVRGKPGQRLILSTEEKRLLVQMGQCIPTTFPLTRNEERTIKTMRRKIRNKISAKASRARRQEYFLNLENRVEDCHKQNQRLRDRVTELEEDKRGLLASLCRMRSYLARVISSTYSPKKGSSIPPLLPLTVPHRRRHQERRLNLGKPASLLLIAFFILASTATMSLPNWAVSDSSKGLSTADQGVLSGRSRVLLNRDTGVEYTMDHESVNSLHHTIPVANNLDDQDDGIPIIRTKIYSVNKDANQVSFQSVKKEIELPDLLRFPMNEGMHDRLDPHAGEGLNVKHQDRLFSPHLMEDL